MRPGNAGANTATAHIEVLAAAIAQLPGAWAAGRTLGDDDPALVRHRLPIRADSGGASHWLADELRAYNAEISIGDATNERFRNALQLDQEEDWGPAVDAGGRVRPGAEVVELSGLVNLDAWPERPRLIVRRERPHPGAQLTLFDTSKAAVSSPSSPTPKALISLRSSCANNSAPVLRSVIGDTKACGLANLPFDCFVNNEVWMQLCFAANDLLACARRISLAGQLARATPRTTRNRLLSIAGAITPTGSRLHLDTRWPWTTHVLNAIAHVRTALTSLQNRSLRRHDVVVDIVVWIATGAASFFALIIVHELGHYAAACAIGVPANCLAVRLNEWPAHVALNSDGQWWAPGSDGYEDAYARHDPELRWLGGFIAAGFVFQVTVMVIGIGALVWLGDEGFGSRPVRISAVLNGLYLLADLVGSLATRSPAGDMSSLLRHARGTGVAIFRLLVGAHVSGAALAA